MKAWQTALFFLILVFLGCGGGGGGGSSSNDATATGRIVQVETGAAPNPAASVQIGSGSVLTDASDGSFQLDAKVGSSVLTADTQTVSSGVWVFNIVPLVAGVNDVGDLWVGPERVTLRGTVRNSATNDPIVGATVSFGGRQGTTNGSGIFSLAEVAYSSATQVAFWGIPGSVRATGFFKTDFSAAPNIASGGIVDVGEIFLVPTSDPNPPGPPYNIWGQVTAPGGPSGAIVRLKQGGVDKRVFNVGPDGKYFFFVVPGSYVISASKGASTAADINVTLTSPTEVIRRDVVIP